MSICDYSKTAVCDLYDNQSDISGQATNVVITTERNGWKELTFDIPSSCMNENGLEENYRLKYLIAEYKIRAITDTETDWFIISEPKIVHSGFSKNVTVTAGHVSQTLKNKNVDLEFSDDEGNNVGTAEQLLTTILEGSGWNVGYVETFTEDDGTIKHRSISGEAGTGALGFIEQLCDVFDAKPIYHGDSQTVDIISMNPFDDIDPKQIPYELIDNNNVIELCYNRNTHNLSKTTNTDNMATRLYAYGSHGDMTGICTLQTAEHSEYRFTVTTTGSEYCFEDLGNKKHFFKGNVSAGNILVYSDMDLTSQLYIWNETKQKAYPLYDKPTDLYVILSNPAYSIEKNHFPYLLGLQYYYDVGLMTDEQFQQVAQFQRDLPVLYQASEESAAAYIAGEQELSRIAEHNTGLLKLKISQQSMDNEYVKLTIDTTENNGVIFRTDYDVSDRKFFQWHVATKLQANGDPVSGTPSVLLVIHNTNPVTWDKVYLKSIYDNNSTLIVGEDGNPADFKYSTGNFPTAITVWSKDLRWSSTDKVYLFCTNSMAGLLGARLSEDEALLENLYNKTDKHTTQFWNADSNTTRPSPKGEEYEWLYAYHKDPAIVGDFYFCWKAKSDTTWRRLFAQVDQPSVQNNAYFYNLKYKTLWHGENGSWVKCESAAEQRVADHFTKVFYYCRRRDMLYKGLYEYYTYACVNLPAGNYAIATDFAFYWTFKTDARTTSTLKIDTVHGYVIPDGNIANVFTLNTIPYETVVYPAENEIADKGFYLGAINLTTGAEEDSKTTYRSGTIRVYESKQYSYSLPLNSAIYFYDVNLKFLSALSVGGTGTFTTPARTRFIRLGSPVQNPNGYVRITNYNTEFYINQEFYTILNPVNPSADPNELIGINPLMEKFADLADQTYITYLGTLLASQEVITTSTNTLTENLCDMIKDGRWQDSNYVTGDEKRLYDDTMDMLRQVSMPEIDYDFTYLDMFGVQNEHYYEEHDVEWPILSITDVAHLIDDEIHTNCWAYIDKIEDCYDQPWKTTVEIDTKLTLAARHGFTDVIARIAEVAKQISSKQSQYDEAVSGNISGSRLEGAILLNQAYLNGGSSNWYTDAQGNIIFESADGLSAMILGGRGLGVANSRNEDGTWQWRTATTGYGMTADEIITGHLDAERISAGSITVDKLMSNVGQELEISSNKALTLFATEDGSRPAGTVHTTDAIIDIRAGYTDENQNVIPAEISIISGGELNLTGGNINVTSNGELNVASSGNFTLTSKGAGLNTTVDGIYIGSDGVNLGGGKVKVVFSGNTSTVDITAGHVSIGSPDNKLTEFVMDGTVGKIKINANNEINISSGKTLKLTSSGSVIIGSQGNAFVVGSNGTNAYIYNENGLESLSDTTHTGVYVGTDGFYVRGIVNNVVHYVKATKDGTVDISGKITAQEGSIAGWTIGQTTITGNKTGIAKTTNDSDIAFWAGNATASSAAFKVAQSGALTATNADIKGSVKATSLYIGATNNSNGTLMALDNNGFIVSSGTTINADKIKSIAGIKVSTNGVVISSSTSDAGAAIKTEAGIKVSTNGVVISSSTSNAATAIKNEAGISVDSTTGVVISASGNAGVASASKISALSVSNGKINISCTDVGTSNSGVYITPTGITVGSSGNIDFSAANSISFKAGSIPSSAISGGGNNYAVVSGIDIDSNGVAVSGSKYIKLDIDANNYVHMSNAGIEMKGNRVVITDAQTNEKTEMWARDDIIVMNPNETQTDKLWRKTVDGIESHMGVGTQNAKHDWVLIRPYYDAKILYQVIGNKSFSQNMLLSKDATESFGDEAGEYAYDLEIVCESDEAPVLELALYAVNGSSEKRITLSSFNSSKDTENSETTGYDIRLPVSIIESSGTTRTCSITFTSKGTGSAYNLASEGYDMYIRLYQRTYSGVHVRITSISVTARCEASVSKVPCTVYYYP